MDAKAIPFPPLLELTSSQLEVALQNSASQVDRLADSVSAFAKLGADMCAHPDPAVAAQGVRITAEAQRAMFAMQYHDQLSQRVVAHLAAIAAASRARSTIPNRLAA